MSTTHHLNTVLMVKIKDKYIFYFNKIYKIWRKGQVPLAMTYFAFGEDKVLCVVETVN